MTELEWIAGRVALGLPVSVGIVMEHFGVTEAHAQDLMAAEWPRLLRTVIAEPVERPRCPRCRAMLIVPRKGHAWCVCGYSDEPADERDIAVDFDPVETPKAQNRPRHKGAKFGAVAVPWTEFEREAWEAFDAGGQVPSLEEWDGTAAKKRGEKAS